MVIRCTGCGAGLRLADDLYMKRVVVRCPECFEVFLVEGKLAIKEETSEEATLLSSDFSPEGDISKFQWRVPGASLTVIYGEDQGVHIKIKGDKFLVGREKADLVLKDPAISRLHFEIIKEGSVFYLRDLGSTNGTFLNGKRIENKVKLSHLDEIWIGKTRLLFSEVGAQEEVKEEDASGEREKLLSEETKAEGAEKRDDMLPLSREYFLEFQTGKKRAQSYKIESSKFVLGRGPEANLSLDDEQVSRKHAVIEIFGKDNIYLSDLASANGTFLNGVRIRTVRLRHNDIIRIGKEVLKFVVKEVL